MLQGYLVHSVQLQPPLSSARVLLAEPEVLETWPRSRQMTLRGEQVNVAPSLTQGLLCVARLPINFTEIDFNQLTSSVGNVTHCFLMRSETSG